MLVIFFCARLVGHHAHWFEWTIIREWLADGMAFTEKIKKAANLLKEAEKVVALTGAGISTRSGIPDFRSPESGVWNNVDSMEVASIYGFSRKPEAFYDWLRPMIATFRQAKPNPAHMALAELETAGYLHAIITQNIDTLHTRAGSGEVYEVHGHMREATCIQCYEVYDVEKHVAGQVEAGKVPVCAACSGTLKPNVILFGEQLPAPALLASEKAARTCDVMLIAGSSLTVSPIADLPGVALRHGAQLIIVNYEPTHIDNHASVVIHEDVAIILPRIAEELEVV